jgi:hypothetical protein
MISPPDERITVQSERHENSYALLSTRIAIVVVIALVLVRLALSADMAVAGKLRLIKRVCPQSKLGGIA